MTAVRVVCCSCQRVIREGQPDAEGRVSHGLCPECLARLYPEFAQPDRVLDLAVARG